MVLRIMYHIWKKHKGKKEEEEIPPDVMEQMLNELSKYADRVRKKFGEGGHFLPSRTYVSISRAY